MTIGETDTTDKTYNVYHGSLEELNSRDRDIQYRFADNDCFFSKIYLDEEFRRGVAEELSQLGFDGLVNVRTNIIPFMTLPSSGQRNILCHRSMEGTPIVRVKN